MASVRNVEVREAYLDAARGAIVDLGLKRLTMTEVARRAHVSRMTLYRTWPDVERMLADLLTREWASVIAEEDDHAASTLDRLVHMLVGTARSMRNNPLFRRILELDRESVLPYILDRRGRAQNELLRHTLALIIEGQRHGEMREGNPDIIVRGVMLAMMGFVFSVGIMLDAASEEELDREFDLILRRCLVP